MGLDDFLGGAAVKPRPVSEPSTVPTGAPGSEGSVDDLDAEAPRAASPTGETEGGSETEAPWGVVEIETPSGIEIYYQAGPKRLYRLRQGLLTGTDPKPQVEWFEVPSMSTVTKILDKPGLVHWGEKVGINLVQELLRNEWVDLEFVLRATASDDPRKPWWTGKHLQEIGKTKQLTNYYMKDAASVRGNSVHSALESWAMSGNLADPDVYPENERGFVVGLNKFLTESRIQPLKSEVIVASIEHRVAGRFDLLGELPEQVSLVHHLTPKNEKRSLFEPGTWLVDLKTSAGVFDDQQLQVTGYRGCMIESGYEEPDRAGVLRVTTDGRYELVESKADWLDFWHLRALYDSLQRIKGKETS